MLTDIGENGTLIKITISTLFIMEYTVNKYMYNVVRCNLLLRHLSTAQVHGDKI